MSEVKLGARRLVSAVLYMDKCEVNWRCSQPAEHVCVILPDSQSEHLSIEEARRLHAQLTTALRQHEQGSMSDHVPTPEGA